MNAEIYKKDDQELKIFYDEIALDPRKDFDNFGIMICSYSNYTLGDKNITPNEIMNEINELKPIVCFPLFVYDHSGLSISCDESRPYPYNDEWDSSFIGFIYATKDMILDNFTGYDKNGNRKPIKKRLTKRMIEQARQLLKSEVEEYNYYLSGQVYGYNISKVIKCNLGHEHNDIIDSCGSFYGHDAIKDDLKAQGWDI